MSTWGRFDRSYFRKYNETFPKCIKQLLIETGYDTVSTLTKIDEEKIKQIECFVNSNKVLLSKLECCYNEECQQFENFEFLPGHKTILMNIKNEISELNLLKKPKKDKSALTDPALKEKLISNLIAASKKTGFEFPVGIISEANIVDYKREPIESANICKCRFSCPFCSKKIPVIFKHFWMSSNVTKHLKSHIMSNKQSD